MAVRPHSNSAASCLNVPRAVGNPPEVATVVANAEAVKVHVAINDRIEYRLIPQSPCPEVQPLPIEVPAPTSSPDITAVAPVMAGGAAAAAPGCRGRARR